MSIAGLDLRLRVCYPQISIRQTTYSLTQCAAVKIHCGCTRVAAQRCLYSSFGSFELDLEFSKRTLRETNHGNQSA